MKKYNLPIIGVVVIVAAVLGACNKKINVEDVFVSGEWKEFIKVEDGVYEIEKDLTTAKINLRLILLNEYTGERRDPAATLSLIPLTKNGSELNYSFLIQSRDRFNEFIFREPGTITSITFSSSSIRSVNLFKINNFELKSFTPEPKLTLIKRTIAFPELTGEVSNDILNIAMGAVTTELFKNNDILNVIDHNQIEAIQKQHDFQLTDWADTSNYAEIGRVLNVNTIAIGTVTAARNSWGSIEYHLYLRFIDIDTFAVIGSFSYSTTTPKDIARNLSYTSIKAKETYEYF